MTRREKHCFSQTESFQTYEASCEAHAGCTEGRCLALVWQRRTVRREVEIVSCQSRRSAAVSRKIPPEL